VPEHGLAKKRPGDRLVLGTDVVIETEGDGKHAGPLVMVHLVESEVRYGTLPQLVHGANAVLQGGNEHLGHQPDRSLRGRNVRSPAGTSLKNALLIWTYGFQSGGTSSSKKMAVT